LINEEQKVVRAAVIELHKEELKFSAGHFMLLSATQRESMHGHDYQIHVAFNTLINHNGMAFDCRLYKQRLLALCQSLDYRFILPGQSEYLRIEETEKHWIAHFNQQAIPFLKQDAVVLPICNVTLEELSYWVLQQLLLDPSELQQHSIEGMTVRVFNGRGESGAVIWKKDQT
jgi:6-pyruvoyltetrahydropterin/6-carboxytetrahydropterin synthase